MTLVRLFFLLFCGAFFTMSASAEQTHIAVASNFTHTMKELIREFEKTSDHQVKASYGSSGKIYAQIKHGAPFQLFFSADQEKPLALYNEGFSAGKPFTYALGALALWSSNSEFNNQELKKLQAGEFNKLSLANPKIAPYGIAAVEVLENLNLVEATQKKWIKGENIAQTYQFVGTGNADLGFVALAQLFNKKGSNKAEYWPVPAKLHQAIRQDAILLKRGEDNAAAKAFIQFISNKQSQAIIASYGYRLHDISDPVIKKNTDSNI